MKRHLVIIGCSLTLCAGCSDTEHADTSAIEVTYNAPVASAHDTTGDYATSSSIAATSTSSRAPSSLLIDVPFTSQAPFGDWGDPYQEACEEASLLMVHAFLVQTTLTPEIADKELRDITSWIQDQGMDQDVTIRQLGWIAETYYGHKTRILEHPTIENIKAELAGGNPVLVPLAGRDIGNPYFSGEGPWYHMLVIIGYDESSFITNEPGTKRGMHYRYKYDVLMSAIHDWTGVKEEIRKGDAVALVVH